MFKNLRQDIRITDAQLEATHAMREAGKAHSQLEKHEERFARLALVTEALWELLKSRTGWTDHELMQHIEHLDAADGIANGRHTPGVAKCHACDRNLPQGGRHCIYCGEPPLIRRPFDGLV
ncbi:MAG: hypothetical protein JNG86_02155 [Verrucomicrobiaceae bacterium]|nr:hypothetical protein [Verrucomicrobiaceae bacterium]